MVVYVRRGREWRKGSLGKPRVNVMKKILYNVAKRSAQLGLALVCMTCLSSCSAVTGLIGFLVSIPFRVIDLICP